MRKNYNAELDFALKELLKAHENQWKPIKDVFADKAEQTTTVVENSLKTKFGLKDWEVAKLLDYLLDEGYIDSIDPLVISFEGAVFSYNGGFTEKAAQEWVNKWGKRTEIFFLVIAAIIGAIYATTQIYDRFNQCCSCHHQ